ncbi:MAG TPA: methanogenesis marker 8 protein [Methanomicrobiales archaeon]|jgi:putative methanogenesis marker protein 8|nr:methanogenesis marker 8 protein [Methanomicrobiales archaeon]
MPRKETEQARDTAGKDEHIIEAIGRTRVVIRDGVVAGVGSPCIAECPLARRFALPVTDFTPEAIRANIENRIRAFGMCTDRREVTDTRDFVGFGASELLSAALRAGLIDAAVLACDGAGTVIAPTAPLIQGIGGRMSGLVSTCPIPAVIDRIRTAGGYVVDPGNASIDQVRGAGAAYDLGYRKVAVTVTDPGVAREVRRLYPDAVIVAVHTTGLSREEAEELVSAADLVTVCASRHLRELAGSALIQAGTGIPVFGFTRAGKEIILAKVRESMAPVVVKFDRLPVAGTGPEPLL